MQLHARSWHSASRYSTWSAARSARCFSHCHMRVSSSISASLAAEDLMSQSDRDTARELFAFLGLANSSSSSPQLPDGRGSFPSAAIFATSSSVLARLLNASRSCSTVLIFSRACSSSVRFLSSCSCRPTRLYLAWKASRSRLRLSSFSRSRVSWADLWAARAVFSSSCSLRMTDWDLKVSLRVRRISFSQRAWVWACVSFARPYCSCRRS